MRARLATLSLDLLSNTALMAGSLAIGVLSAFRYFRVGYGHTVFLLWVLTIGTAGYAAFREDRGLRGAELVQRSDWTKALLVVLILSPLYLGLIRTIPYQISTDEVTIMMNEAETSAQPQWDIFSLSGYFSFPSFIFVAYGWVGRLLGGIDLASMRTLDALVGLASVGVFYLLARQILSTRMAFAAAALLGTNHALVAISRMAMRNNSALLVVLAGLLFLFSGLKDRRVSWTFVGGAITGLAFYIYEPARLLLIIWLTWLVLVVIGNRTREASGRCLRHAVFGLVGFALVVAPVVAGTLRATSADPDALLYQRRQLLVFQEAQKLQQEWVGAASLVEGVKVNIAQGLTAYNSGLHDNGYVYLNPGHGFVDPLTGILLWIGVLATASSLRGRRPEDYLVLAGFMIPWLTFSFMTNKAPNYTRMLITLPFVAYLALRGIELVATRLSSLVSLRKPNLGKLLTARVLAGGLVGSIAVWNLGIYADYALAGLFERESVGATSRYIEARAADEEHAFYISGDHEHSFFEGGETWHWEALVRFFAGADAQVQAVPIDLRGEDLGSGPFTVFMTRQVWQDNAACLTSRYPHRQVHDLTTSDWYLAIEVLPTENPLSLYMAPCS